MIAPPKTLRTPKAITGQTGIIEVFFLSHMHQQPRLFTSALGARRGAS